MKWLQIQCLALPLPALASVGLSAVSASALPHQQDHVDLPARASFSTLDRRGTHPDPPTSHTPDQQNEMHKLFKRTGHPRVGGLSRASSNPNAESKPEHTKEEKEELAKLAQMRARTDEIIKEVQILKTKVQQLTSAEGHQHNRRGLLPWPLTEKPKKLEPQKLSIRDRDRSLAQLEEYLAEAQQSLATAQHTEVQARAIPDEARREEILQELSRARAILEENIEDYEEAIRQFKSLPEDDVAPAQAG